MLAGIVGFPLGHSLSPVIHNAGFNALGLDVHYEAWPTPPDELPAAIERVREPDLLGMSVTIPHKQTVMALLDEIDPVAAAIGSVNTVVKRGGRLIGYNTDKDGFIHALRRAGCDPAGMRALVLGVGGTERAVAYGLIEAGASAVGLAGRRPERVAEAARHLETTKPFEVPISQHGFDEAALAAAVGQADLVVNCTPIGMRHTPEEHESPLPRSLLRRGLWVADAVYTPLETKLLWFAREAGAHPVDGLGMLILQAVAQQVLWTGREPPVDIMMAAAAAALTERE
jgi:shikimate dehydrogenase